MAAAPVEKIKVKVQAEFWFDPVDHVPLEERRAMLLKGRRKESLGGHGMLGADAVLKQVTPGHLLKAFMSELARAFEPLSAHGCQAQIVNQYSSRYNCKNGQSSGQQIHDHIFADQTSVKIQKDTVVVNFEPVQVSSHLTVNSEDGHPFEDCRFEDSQPSVSPGSCLVPFFGPKGSSSGQRDAGAGCDEMALSSTNHITMMKVEPSDDRMPMTTESEQEHADFISMHEQCKLPIFSSIAGGFSQVDVFLEPYPLAEAGSITTAEGRMPICSLESTLQEDLSSHAWGASEQVFSYPEDCGKEHGGDKLNEKSPAEFPLKKSVVNYSKVNTAEHTSISMSDMPPKSSTALSPCISVRLSSMGVNNQHDVSLGDSNLNRTGRCSDINSNRACRPEHVAVVSKLQEQSSLKAKKWLSDPILSTDPVRMKNKFGDKYFVSDENAAKRVCTSFLVSPESYTLNQARKDSSDICLDSFSTGNNNLPESVIQSPAVGKNGGQFEADNLLCDASLPTSVIMVKVESADEDADAPHSETGVVRESHLFHPITEDVLAAVKEKNYSNTRNQSLGGAFSVSPGRVKAKPAEEIHAVGPSETINVMKCSALTSSSGEDKCEATLCSTVDMQTIRDVDTTCNEKMSENLPAGSNHRDVPPDSVLSAFPKIEMIETLEHVGGASYAESTVNFSSFSESSDKAVGMKTCPALPTFPARVKDEPLEEYRVVPGSEPMTENCSTLPVFDSLMNGVLLNLLPETQCSSNAINSQRDSVFRVCNMLSNHESATSSYQDNVPEDTGIFKGQKQNCMVNKPIDSDASKGIKILEQLEERSANVISENIVGTSNSSYASSNLQLKSEPVDGDVQNLCNNLVDNFFSSDTMLSVVKSELADELSVDILDRMPLTERIRLLASSMASEFKLPRKSKCFKQTKVHAASCDYVDSFKDKANSKNRRKRKKTATDSVEIALEEDAPGLLQGLLDRGINLDEIKLYGCEEDVDPFDISSNEDSFQDLEAVISKLFSERPSSLFKLAPLQPAKGTKAVYCLACLISLIEQTRYLHFRNCPVEWGWCRDLQSFIFVFKMHNRIVLERPEYGYATYFFELVESFPIDWQLKRLVTSMKLTSCSRATLIENKSLLVGVDLSEGEACILEEYGWRPNTGLGSLLNYCDRVVHDRNERDTSEWRQKIGKLLMDGYDGGSIVKVDLPKKVIDYVGSHYPQIKMEMI